jgi:hypothetical protein
MKKKFFSFLKFSEVAFSSSVAIGLGAILGLSACTNDKSASVSPTQVTSLAAAEKAKGNEACAAEDLVDFERAEGEVVDLEHETLPRGIFLATESLMLLEKPAVAGKTDAPTRLLVREMTGEKLDAEIVCSENTERLADGFDISVSGVVKFDTVSTAAGADFTSRQFYVYADKNGRGVVVSNSKLMGRERALKQLIAGGQFVRLDDRHFVVKTSRERDGAKARLQIKLELIPQN